MNKRITIPAPVASMHGTGIKAAVSPNGELLIYGFVGDEWEEMDAKTIIKQIQSLGNLNELVVRINSGGGFVFEGLAIFNYLNNYESPVRVVIDGIAASMASVIAMAGDVIEMPENAQMMIHNPWDIAIGDADEMRKHADLLDRVKDSLLSIYENRTGLDRDELSAMMNEETWMNGVEAVERGFATVVTDSVDAAALTRVDLSAFAKAPEFLKNVRLQAVAGPHPDGIIPGSIRASVGTLNHEDEDMTTTAQPAKGKEPSAEGLQPTAVDDKSIKDATDKASKEATTAERKRASDIRAAVAAAKLPDTFATELVDSGVSIHEARAKIIDTWAEAGGPAERQASFGIGAGLDERDKIRAAASSVIAHRMGVGKDDRENHFRGMSLSQIAASVMASAGVRTDRMTKSEIATKVLNAHSTSDFPYLLADAANKKLQAAYEAFPSTWQAWCARGSVTDFKTVNLIRMGSFNSLDVIPEGEEYTQGTFSEEREQLTPQTKGKYIKLTRQMIINDDLSGFTRMAQMLGRAAARTINEDVYSIINTNGNMADGNPLFDTTHANLAGTAGLPSITTLSKGRAAMRKQKAPGANANQYLNIMPRFLLVPVDLEDSSNVIVTSEGSPDDNASSRKKNPIRDWGPLQVLSDPLLDATSLTAWYLVADPMDVPLVEVHFLDGVETPYVENEVEFLTDAISWKVRLDYGTKANDWRGGYKNAGA